MIMRASRNTEQISDSKLWNGSQTERNQNSVSIPTTGHVRFYGYEMIEMNEEWYRRCEKKTSTNVPWGLLCLKESCPQHINF